MSEIKRLTLISDPTDEFPKNANNSFKVRLPERLTLPGEGWHASLMSLTVPDQGQSNAVIAADPHTKVVKFKYPHVVRRYQLGSYRRVENPNSGGEIELEDVMNANQIVATGSQFWKRVMQEVHNNIMDILMKKQVAMLVANRDERPIVSVKKIAMPGDSCYSQKGFVEREPNHHGGVLHQLGHCAQVWIVAQKERVRYRHGRV